ncbi:Pyruvate ferredoxin/flavodoxin oxidoreductase [Sphingobium herbicidovorans NBRC 16415]|uniref:Pyruvate ferredoxin/flavodoxin oxidoreductase n=1 Tax=Sphingobium herbicidovorans (strain ATCC 700291 / DSM 11019 / CCUG 56400 / KCTC 2939 / LMG 18315 / NBRC 16415 / MH) TaxID=1219045 RepID=A0A086PBZ7_SPHHM|nr:indolepyruvate ferredoxin oxidoreductase family protein [Sphingobium herbicidovorans]KFG90915.1 Pyruvate ferredoxin/flavodoxin oxidoreductase [Sphingobium herbicidovorans NBRC 16415]
MVGVSIKTPSGTGGEKKFAPKGNVKFLSGIDALLEGMVAARKLDGEGYAAFVTGYRGSPLGTFDSMLFKDARRLASLAITFKPGLNEDLAATACWGTQQTDLMDGPRYEGVTAFWYGKGPGVDRSGDALKHGNMAGVHPKGGVVLFVGDDHGAKSSTVAHQSDQVLAAACIPVLYPANLQEYRDIVPVAVAMSRFSGVWVAIKCVTETIEANALINVENEIAATVSPQVDVPPGGYHIGQGHVPVAQERTLYAYRLPAAKRFAEVNGLYRVERDSDRRTLGIIAPGKSYVDTIEALRLLGIDEPAAARLGIRVLRPLLAWPISETPITDFAAGHDEVMVVEEKRSQIEEQIGGFILRMPDDARPVLSGKLDPSGAPLLSDHGELDPLQIARAVGSRLIACGLADEASEKCWLELDGNAIGAPVGAPPRMPAFCSGCPHNRSTKLPDGSMAFGGIGCHGMALFVPELRTPTSTQMGGEGTNWIGLADYVATPHIFQNMGEGTYTHSGALAIRAAVAANARITYKILHNGATAMTGGQAVEGEFSAGQIAGQLIAEGVRQVVLVNTDGVRPADAPAAVTVRPRTDLDAVQRELRQVEGVTALIFEQGCATEKRRLRKRGLAPDPDMRTYINPDVCEGCGDCSRKSNCVSILPLETEQGRKRALDQESCNKDYSCIEGFCPSFLSITGGKPRGTSISADLVDQMGASIVEPKRPLVSGAFNIVFAGIGGSGVITLGRSVALAARAEEKRISAFDVTGLAQKNGPVYSHVRLFDAHDDADYQARIPSGQLDLLIGCDIIATASQQVTPLVSTSRTRAFISEELVPTASFQTNPDQSLALSPYAEHLTRVLPRERLEFVKPGPMLRTLVGTGAHHNILVLGYATQRGAVPVSTSAIEEALGAGTKAGLKNLFAFRAGRLLAQDPALLERLLDKHSEAPVVPLEKLPLDALLARCRALLASFQNEAYADRYSAFVAKVRDADPQERFTHAVAHGLFRLMRYKDEYEVARLLTDPQRMAEVRSQFSGDLKISYNLAPPLLARRRASDGEPIKMKFGPWLGKVLPVLAKFKFLRGTPFDPFGMFADRRLERQLIRDYIHRTEALLDRLGIADYATAVAIAKLPLLVRGYGPVKERSVVAMEAEYDRLIAKIGG